MENLKLNETPVRTSRNFGINNIAVENVEIPVEIQDFANVQMVCGSAKIAVEEAASRAELRFGLSETLTRQVNEHANQNLRVDIHSKTASTTKLAFPLDEKNSCLIENIEIVAGENTKATVIVQYTAAEGIVGYHNGILRVRAGRGAAIDVVCINLLSSASQNFLAIEAAVHENARAQFTLVDFGGKNSVTNFYADLRGKNADSQVSTIYLGHENQLFDLNYIGELRGEKSNIDIDVQGALKDTARKHFKGTIDFKKGCKKACGNENENCMLLSDTAKSLALPMLLCSEEDVEGNHSSSAGQIGEKELFYIMSRGFSLKEAQKLMVRAKFNRILENVKDEELKNQIWEEIDKKLE